MKPWTEKRKAGWVVRWRDPQGGKHTTKAYGSKGEAKAAARQFAFEHPTPPRPRLAGPRPSEPIALTVLADRWAESHQDPNRPGRDYYCSEACLSINLLCKRLNVTYPKDIRPESIEGYTGGRRALSYLRAVLRWAAKKHGQPFPPELDQALAVPQSREAEAELMTEAQVAAALAAAEPFGQRLLLDCLATYGWRPITAARLTCGDVRTDGTIRLLVKRNGAHVHPLFPQHHSQLSELTFGRDARAPLFLDPTGVPWSQRCRVAIPAWYRRHIRQKDSKTGSVYGLKRYALSRMETGLAPWRRALAFAEIKLYTGQKTESQVRRYLRTNLIAARALMGELDEGAKRGQKGQDESENVLLRPCDH